MKRKDTGTTAYGELDNSGLRNRTGLSVVAGKYSPPTTPVLQEIQKAAEAVAAIKTQLSATPLDETSLFDYLFMRVAIAYGEFPNADDLARWRAIVFMTALKTKVILCPLRVVDPSTGMIRPRWTYRKLPGMNETFGAGSPAQKENRISPDRGGTIDTVVFASSRYEGIIDYLSPRARNPRSKISHFRFTDKLKPSEDTTPKS